MNGSRIHRWLKQKLPNPNIRKKTNFLPGPADQNDTVRSNGWVELDELAMSLIGKTHCLIASICVGLWIGGVSTACGQTVPDPQLPVAANEAAQEEGHAQQPSLAERIDRIEMELLDGKRGPAFSPSWKNGLYFESASGDFRARFGGRIEQDWLWITGDDGLETAVGTLEDGVFFRRARIQGNGTIYGIIDYFAEFEFAPVENIVFQDVWIQLNQLGWIGKLRAGHLKVPFGLDNETSARHLTFLERSAVHDAFQQEYDPGIMVWNNFFNDDFRYAVSYLRFDPRESGTSLGNGQHSFAARVSGAPFHSQDDRRLIHLGGAIRINDATTDNSSGLDGFRFRARPEFRNTPRYVDTGFFEADGAVFLGAEAAIVADSFSLQGEYVSTMVSDAVSPALVPLGDVHFSGYYVQASYFLTGEHRPYSRSNGAFGRINPINPVKKLGSSGICWGGAMELKARYSHVDLIDGSIDGGELENGILGLNWYLVPNAKVMCDYIWTRRTAAVSIHWMGAPG